MSYGIGTIWPQRRIDVVAIEQRRHPLMARAEVAVGAFRVAQRQLRRITQQDGHQLGAGRVRVDRPAKAALHQQRQAPAVIDVRVAEHHRVDARGIERKRAAIAPRRVGAALDHAAVEQYLAAGRAHDVAGPGHFSGGTEKLQLHAGRTLTSVHSELARSRSLP